VCPTTVVTPFLDEHDIAARGDDGCALSRGREGRRGKNKSA
jgi:hypothetical protein